MFVFAGTVLFLLFCIVLLTACAFLAGGGVSPAIMWVSIFMTAAFAGWWSWIQFRKRAVVAYVVTILVVATSLGGSILINRGIYDISYDGQTYHQEAVLRLVSGWNPVYQELPSATIGGENKWINYYPKAAWINAAYLYLLTHEERAAKSANIVLILVSMALIYAALRDANITDRLGAAAIALVLGANPVSVYQALSFYLDGQLMSLFLSICATFVIIYAGKRRFAFLPLVFALVLFVNLKFTALVYAVALVGIFTLAAWMKEDERLAVRTLVAGGAAIVIGVALVGFSPYATNVLRYGSPFYPLQGKNAIDLKPFNVPGDFIPKSSADILFRSFFSASGGIKGEGTAAVYKTPFTYSQDELSAFHYTDPIEGGFGPLFGGAIIVAAALLLAYYAIARYRPSDEIPRRRFQLALALIAMVFGLSIVNPISSLARYVPQAYLLAVLPVILWLSIRRNGFRAVAYAAVALLLFNTALVGMSYAAYNLQTSAAIGKELAALAAQSREKPIPVLFNEFKSTRTMLAEAGVAYVTTTDPAACRRFQRVLPENTTEFCVP